jgi:hypothetical protein
VAESCIDREFRCPVTFLAGGAPPGHVTLFARIAVPAAFVWLRHQRAIPMV